VAEKSGDARDYDYLLSMKIWSLTMEQVQKLRNEQEDARQELETVRGTSVQEMWKADLTSLEEVLEEVKKATSISAVVPLVPYKYNVRLIIFCRFQSSRTKKSRSQRKTTAPKRLQNPKLKQSRKRG
jgi:hypothetical protein